MNVKDVSFIVDKSYSMEACRNQVISGYNEFIGDLKRNTDLEIRFTLTYFDTEVRLVHDGLAIEKVEPMTAWTYQPAGNTALYDALGMTIKAIEERYRQAPGDPTILVVIMTDGQENSSKSYTREHIRDLITGLDRLDNWTFVYLGADQDAWAASAPLGFTISNTASYASRDTARAMRGTSIGTQNLIISSTTKKSDDFFGKGDSPTIPPEKK